jgi:hypothetical protein
MVENFSPSSEILLEPTSCNMTMFSLFITILETRADLQSLLNQPSTCQRTMMPEVGVSMVTLLSKWLTALLN